MRAIVKQPVEGVKRGTIVKCKRTRNGYKLKNGLTVDFDALFPLPESHEILDMVEAVAPHAGLFYSVKNRTFRLLSFDYGTLVEDVVPVYSDGINTGERTIKRIAPMRVSSPCIDDCLRRIFRRVYVGEVYGNRGETRLIYDDQLGQFREVSD